MPPSALLLRKVGTWGISIGRDVFGGSPLQNLFWHEPSNGIPNVPGQFHGVSCLLPVDGIPVIWVTRFNGISVQGLYLFDFQWDMHFLAKEIEQWNKVVRSGKLDLVVYQYSRLRLSEKTFCRGTGKEEYVIPAKAGIQSF